MIKKVLMILVFSFLVFGNFRLQAQLSSVIINTSAGIGTVWLDKAFLLKGSPVFMSAISAQTEVASTIKLFPKPTELRVDAFWGEFNEPIHRIFGIKAAGKFGLINYNNFYLNGLAELGVCYAPFPYSVSRNFTNNMLGSYINVICGGGAELGYNLNKKWQISITASVLHVSNGEFQKPNDGLNFINYPVSVSYKISSMEKPLLNLHKLQNKHSCELFLSYALREVKALQPEKFVVVSGSATYFRSIVRNLQLGIATDVFFDANNAAAYTLYPQGSSVQAGFSGLWKLNFDNLSVEHGLGVYWYNKYSNRSSTYNRLNLKWHIKPLFLVLSYNRHKGSGYYIGYGLGYKF